MWPWLRHDRSAVLCGRWWRLQAGDKLHICRPRCRGLRDGAGRKQPQAEHLCVHHSPHPPAAPGAPPPVPLATIELRASHHNTAPGARSRSTTPDAHPTAHSPLSNAGAAAAAPTPASSRSQLCCGCTVVLGGRQKGLVLLASPYRVSYHPGAPTAAASDCEAPTASTSDREASTPAAAAGGSSGSSGSRDDLVPL